MNFKYVTLFLLCSSLFTCDDRYGPTQTSPIFQENIMLEWPRINRIELSDFNWQTIYTMSGKLIPENEEVSVENFRVTWSSDMHWLMGDTSKYFRQLCRTCEMGVLWDRQDGSHDTIPYDFHSMPPVTNQVSITNADGEFSNVLAPVRSMRDRTMTLYVSVNGALVDSQSIFLME